MSSNPAHLNRVFKHVHIRSVEPQDAECTGAHFHSRSIVEPQGTEWALKSNLQGHMVPPNCLFSRPIRRRI